jgi:hypothetical protein
LVSSIVKCVNDMNVVIMLTLKMMIIIRWVKFKVPPNMPLLTQKGCRSKALPKPDLNTT